MERSSDFMVHGPKGVPTTKGARNGGAKEAVACGGELGVCPRRLWRVLVACGGVLVRSGLVGLMVRFWVHCAALGGARDRGAQAAGTCGAELGVAQEGCGV
jgi:hypothetical protein